MISARESDLIIQLRRGSKDAFERIFDLYYQRIYNFCIRLLRDPDESEEIVQKVFIALWEQQHRLDESKPLAPYLFLIARNMVYQEFRKRVYRKAAFIEIAGSGTDFSETTKDEVLFKELTDVLQKLTGQLPPRQREIFQLSRDSGLSYKEIALKLGITENTVDTQIRRTLNYLRSEFERYFK